MSFGPHTQLDAERANEQQRDLEWEAERYADQHPEGSERSAGRLRSLIRRARTALGTPS